jgi:hypothetical protein
LALAALFASNLEALSFACDRRAGLAFLIFVSRNGPKTENLDANINFSPGNQLRLGQTINLK